MIGEHGYVSTRAPLGALVGLITAGVAVGVGEAVAAFVRPAAAPVIAVGNRLITLTPSQVERSATQTVGTNDKPLLLLGIYVLLAGFGALIGWLAVRRLVFGLVGVAVLAAFGCYCALTANGSRGSDVVPTLVGAAASAGVLVGLVRLLRPAEPMQSLRLGKGDATSARGAAPRLAERRSFLQGGAVAAGLAAVAGFGGRAVQHARFDVADDRAKVALPSPVAAQPAAPRGTDLGRSGVPWATSADSFYRIDTALSVPQLSTADWSLRIHGLVDKEITLDYAQLRARPLIERWVTLCCVSNEIGGGLVGNARWLGARLADLLTEAGIQDGCDQLLMTSVDGYTFGAPTKVVMDGRDALLAVGMNGEPLPLKHGFPVRVVVPGLYGYVSACKWVVDIEATTFDAQRAYWVQGGWANGAQQPDIKLMSRIDTPHSGGTVAVGKPVAIAGVAWDQHVGVSKVEVQVDDGDWLPARLAAVPSADTWRQWVVPWTPPRAGSYRLRVRATDGAGKPQIEASQPVFPAGATGLHSVTVRAS